MRSDLRYVIVGKGFNKYAVTGRSKLTGNKALAITRENDKVETCICFEDDDAIRNLIKALSTLLTNDPLKRIEAEPVKHAHWVACEDEYEDEYKCSACGGIQFFAITPQDEGWEYCPYCGAKMDEEEEK